MSTRAWWLLGTILASVYYCAFASNNTVKQLPHGNIAFGPSCQTAANTSFKWSLALLREWKKARTLLDVNTLEDDCDTSRTLTAYLAGHGEWIGRQPNTPYGGVLNTFRGTCRASWKGTQIIYNRVYKGANDAICENLQDLDDNSPIKNVLHIAFVRDPLEHWISGYSEIAYRAHSHPSYMSYLYSFTKEGKDEEAKALAFVRDFAAGRFHRVHDITDVHCFPQVAFLANVTLDYLGDLADLQTSWKSFGQIFGLLGWPAFKFDYSETHSHTDHNSGSDARLAMKALVFHVGSPYREAICRLLLPDFVCFKYALPDDCASLLGKHGVECPYEFPPRSIFG
jgi:hypothetical protein